MNNQEYIAALGKALASMPRQNRDEILQEIQSHIDDLGGGQSLLERFGDPRELAAQYLDGEPPPPIRGRVTRVGSRLLAVIGGIVVIGIGLLALMIHIFSQDEFNYADESAPELALDRGLWSSMAIETPLVLEIRQARVTVYWHQRQSLDWKCEGNGPSAAKSAASLEIRHDDCLLYLPIQTASIKVDQGSLVVVRPQASLRLTLMQSNLRIAENQSEYRYQVEKTNSNIDVPASSPRADTLIEIAATESSVQPYEY